MAKKGLGESWGENEIRHINILEMKTIKFGVLTYCKKSKMKHAIIMPDNTIAIAYINKKAGLKSSESNDIAKEIWPWCASSDLHTRATYNLGK